MFCPVMGCFIRGEDWHMLNRSPGLAAFPLLKWRKIVSPWDRRYLPLSEARTNPHGFTSLSDRYPRACTLVKPETSIPPTTGAGTGSGFSAFLTGISFSSSSASRLFTGTPSKRVTTSPGLRR